MSIDVFVTSHLVFLNITMMWIRRLSEGKCSLSTKFKIWEKEEKEFANVRTILSNFSSFSLLLIYMLLLTFDFSLRIFQKVMCCRIVKSISINAHLLRTPCSRNCIRPCSSTWHIEHLYQSLLLDMRWVVLYNSKRSIYQQYYHIYLIDLY